MIPTTRTPEPNLRCVFEVWLGPNISVPLTHLRLLQHFAMPQSKPAQHPDTTLTLTEPTPPVHSSDLPAIPGSKPPVAGRVPSKQPTGSALSVGPQRSLTGTSAISLTTESGWHLAVSSNVQRDNDFVDEWQRAMDVLLIFVSNLDYFINYSILGGNIVHRRRCLALLLQPFSSRRSKNCVDKTKKLSRC